MLTSVARVPRARVGAGTVKCSVCLKWGVPRVPHLQLRGVCITGPYSKLHSIQAGHTERAIHNHPGSRLTHLLPQARMRTPWAFNTMASCARRSCYCARTARPQARQEAVPVTLLPAALLLWLRPTSRAPLPTRTRTRTRARACAQYVHGGRTHQHPSRT